MGYMRHHAIVVTGPMLVPTPGPNIVTVHYHLAGLAQGLISEIVESKVNAYGSFLIAPDGSKEGWSESDEGDKTRTAVIAYLESLRYADGSMSFDWAEIQFGDDDRQTKICRHSDQVEIKS